MPRRALLALAASLVLTAPLAATWSIVLVDTRTGEIAIAGATCLTGDLTRFIPVMVVGKGGGCAQASVDTANRVHVFDQLKLGTDPVAILQALALRDPGHQTRQYGIVDTRGRAIGFTGAKNGAWAGDRTGRVGDIVYAVQGNVLTGAPVLAAAELAIWWTPGDLATKAMAAMEAARAMGGDGRCSCPGGTTTCGSPPASFARSALIAFLMVARIGDSDGVCNGSVGCANGGYYLRLNVTAQAGATADPVIELQRRFDAWVIAERGRPDHLRSSVVFDPPLLPADPRAQTTAHIVLRDRDGRRIGRGGASVTGSLDPSSTAQVTFGSAVDHGDGSYSLPIRAGAALGTAVLRIAVDDGGGPRTLAPLPELLVDDVPLWASHTRLSAAAGATVDFVLQPDPKAGINRPFVLLASNSGSSPGIWIPPLVILPLNPDPLFFATATAAFTFQMPELIGVIPGSGPAATSLRFPPGAFGLPLGSDVSFAYVLWNPVDYASNAVAVRLGR